MSAAASAGRIPKPTHLKDISKRWLTKQIYLAVLFGIAGSSIRQFFWVNPRHKAYEDFWKTYDPYADFERMRNMGIFSSCPPDDVLAEQKK